MAETANEIFSADWRGEIKFSQINYELTLFQILFSQSGWVNSRWFRICAKKFIFKIVKC